MYELCWKSGNYIMKCLKQDHVTPPLGDLKWINFRIILRLNEASFTYKNLFVSADSNVKRLTLTSETRYHRETAQKYI